MTLDEHLFTVCIPFNKRFLLGGTCYYDYETEYPYVKYDIEYSSAKIIGRTRHNNLILVYRIELIAQGMIYKAIFCKKTGKCINVVGNKHIPQEFRRMYIKDFQLYSSNEIT